MIEDELTPVLIRHRIKVNMDVLEHLEYERMSPDRIEDQLRLVDRYLAAYREHLATRRELIKEIGSS